ncbi:hypothetical protein [Saccharopolyspora phatthalungensis]|uniref:Transcriptional regulator with XRE-family HTH domain n=1 Tax=Saccharopolyspora phatthalungensis TaxID=664693 RepID=A0A840QAV2_9PSEU|nr:hypothetical protein [Saccharopolyspora phatthalungensis]MBB5157077.1 transcriptional regulator with XRE-family HTH domain [Saccharopolyspora phatthalungensis]
MTQQQVVSRLRRYGVETTNKTLSCLEHGTGVDVARLPELAQVLECTTTFLLGLTTAPRQWEPDADECRPTAPAARLVGGAAPLILAPGVPAEATRVRSLNRGA